MKPTMPMAQSSFQNITGGKKDPEKCLLNSCSDLLSNNRNGKEKNWNKPENLKATPVQNFANQTTEGVSDRGKM